MLKYFSYLSNSTFFCSVNNNIRNRVEKQIWSKENPIPKNIVMDNPELFFRTDMTVSAVKLFDYLCFMDKKYPVIWVKQSTMAEHLGISRQYVNKLLRAFEELGLITTNYRHMHSSLYKISSYFKNPFIRSRLSHILPSLKSLSIILLTQCFQGLLSNNNYNTYTQLKSNRSTVVISPNRKVGRQVSQKPILDQVANAIYDKSPISIAIREIKVVKLTKWGQIKLSAFPEEAIKHAESKMEYFPKARDPFNLFFKICLEYCKEEQINPNWQLVSKLSSMFFMPENAPMILQKYEDPKSIEFTLASNTAVKKNYNSMSAMCRNATQSNFPSNSVKNATDSSKYNFISDTSKKVKVNINNSNSKLGYYQPWGGFKETNPDFDQDGFRFEWSARKMIENWHKSSGFLKQCMKGLLIKHINECRPEHIEQLMKELQ